jgi:hypothetical protein
VMSSRSRKAAAYHLPSDVKRVYDMLDPKPKVGVAVTRVFRCIRCVGRVRVHPLFSLLVLEWLSHRMRFTGFWLFVSLGRVL